MTASGQQAGSIRGVVYDKDFDVPMPRALVRIAETGQQTTGTDDGNYVFAEVSPGTYTLVFTKDGYLRQIATNVIVAPGRVTEVNAELPGEFTEMEEFIVRELQIGGATEADLLRLRQESSALIDSISAELMSRAGAGDAAAALRLVSGATVQDGKYAVIRGLPDRYVNAQMNGVRLPTADAEKRAVELDQFPAASIESVRISKTFTPDQQGDASGGAVNVVLKSIPKETILEVKGQASFNSQVRDHSHDFLTYTGGGVSTWGNDHGGRDPQLDRLGESWQGAVGVSRGEAPNDYKWSAAAGGSHEFDKGFTVGAFTSFFYERDSSFYDNGINDSYWVAPGQGLVPQTIQGLPELGEFKTKLFDVTQASQSVQWGALGTIGVESENHAIGMTYLYTRSAEDTATLAEDTRGKEYFFPGHDPDDPTTPGHGSDERDQAPYLRTETLAYIERTADTLQWHGNHKLPIGDGAVGELLTFAAPELDWTLSLNSARYYEPDKRQFGSLWKPRVPFPPPFEQFSIPAAHSPFKPDVNFTLGNLQRTWRDIEEDSQQYSIDLTLPFEKGSDGSGSVKLGIFGDKVERTFDQDTFSNFAEGFISFEGDFEEFWSAVFPMEDHPITDGPPFVDVDYTGDQRISAWYWMLDLPILPSLNVIGGIRYESTELGVVNFAEEDARWFPPGSTTGVVLNPGDADVQIEEDDVLPAIGLVYTPLDPLTFRASYSETIARQTFREITPIIQQEFLGGPVFIGNPDLQMSHLENLDFRLDYVPYEGALISGSWFHKDITDPIEVVHEIIDFSFDTPVNYPEGELSGFEIEVRQSLGELWEAMDGLSLGANATFIDAEVTLPEDEAAEFEDLGFPMATRDMVNAPEYLYNLYLTYDLAVTGTQFALFYTVKGDTLVSGAGQSNGFVIPSVYATEYGTLNLTIAQRLGQHVKLVFQAKNLTNPAYEEVYRSESIGGDVLKSSYTTGVEYSIGLTAEFTF
jgi:outer membrane receptor protein involved in Fe transport